VVGNGLFHYFQTSNHQYSVCFGLCSLAKEGGERTGIIHPGDILDLSDLSDFDNHNPINPSHSSSVKVVLFVVQKQHYNHGRWKVSPPHFMHYTR
jgi:hypothetical protein